MMVLCHGGPARPDGYRRQREQGRKEITLDTAQVNKLVTDTIRLLDTGHKANMQAAENMWRLNKEAGLTQREIGKRIGKSSSTVGLWISVYVDSLSEASDSGLTFTERIYAKKGDAASIEARHAQKFLREAEPEQKAQIITDLLKDPKVARDVVETTAARVAMNDAEAEIIRERGDKFAKNQSQYDQAMKPILQKVGNLASLAFIEQFRDTRKNVQQIVELDGTIDPGDLQEAMDLMQETKLDLLMYAARHAFDVKDPAPVMDDA